MDGTLIATRDRAIAEQSKNYRYSTNHQVVIDADTRLLVVIGQFLSGNRSDARHEGNPAPRPPSAEHSRSPTAAVPAPSSSCPAAGARAKTFRTKVCGPVWAASASTRPHPCPPSRGSGIPRSPL